MREVILEVHEHIVKDDYAESKINKILEWLRRGEEEGFLDFEFNTYTK
jgi:hypothetical protein|tara:strand:- start:58 stop:201 length:144 start_codon:yes stop_codon:yes gene_type:complete